MFRHGKVFIAKLKNSSFKGSWRSRGSSAGERALQYTVGQKIHGFTVKEVTAVPDLFLTSVKLSHDATGAQYLHAARDDSNNLFSVQFRTTPMDSTGVPHILEHTVLCGSQRFPCRDPFFKMLNRSLSTFMNAFTASDYTMYPFSTQNAKDFQNLLSVYLDAVFFPCLRELDFWQEGWRLEHKTPTDPSSLLMFKGVVFNEMKGEFSDNERLYAQHLQNKLLPDHTYAVVSGGEPLAIPDLTWEQLKHFHATHYHPSNARFFTYGDLPLEQHLQQIEEEALSKFERAEPNTAVPPQKHWDKPRVDHVTCMPDALAPDPVKQNTLCMSYLLGDITDTFEAFTLSLLSSLMISGPNSPFYKALIEPGIGSDFSSSVGFDGSTRLASFTIGLQGMAEADTETVKHIIAQSIDDIIATGFEEEQIGALLHKIEIQMKHQSTSFGLALASYIASCWNHDGDPVQLLKISENVSRFRQCLKENPRYLQDKVQHYFKDNTHRLTLTMSPDERFLEKQAEAEEQKLQQKIQNLSHADHKDIYEKGLQLLAVQSTTIYAFVFILVFQGIILSSSCLDRNLPDMFQLWSDIFNSPHFDDEQRLRVLVMMSAQELSNGISYSGHMYAMTSAARTLAPTADLQETFGGMDQVKFMKRIAEMTDLASVLRKLPRIKRHLLNPENMSPHFDDEQRLRVLVMMSAQELSNGISYSGHMYAMTSAARTLAPTADLQETFGGMDQVKFMKRIAEMTDLTSVLRKLPRIKRHLLNPENMRCAVNATPQKMSDAAGEVERFMGNIAANRKERKPVRPTVVERALDPQAASSASRKLISEPHFKPCQMKTYFQLPFNVNFVSECVRTVPFSHADYASLCILARMMTTKFLHGEIREKGGAYEGGATMGGGGLFSFYSDRDPNSTQTLSAFRGGVEWARAGKFTQQDIDEAKLSVFSAVDAPVAPSDKGLGHFLNGITDEIKQRYRERLFAVTDKNLIDVAGRYLGVGQQTCGVAILGPENESIRKDPSWVVK
ncbi:presequence protease, mitochondrial-like [Sinocyclocheilus grahami]|uniref:presequence protease, mitochondrial-like n=1 Tax=Sinocyclocheilus grahami TaxID=75366 RepID=UPI0007AD303F|nr:PREDICTED: presequence protease, mitochondrial-like [Sinocyclocheilus grahami]